ncbi:BamA/TamA family outer membrane protein [Longimicrobium sp.]|uniref:BamA/TamA family outer membrane protein n=1 Tax=Longimicrobium sp. TaxID=2029185 RepID=UPI002E334286|nr:BamA/TamA family outer membrane protein [Longimicrobium sp.]HEX6040175.1 BamA/TamA family outer membrane protein [Longimicrobium sp.]
MLLTAALAALLQGTPAAPPAALPQDTASAYLDPTARSLVAGARERRQRVERTIDLYRVTARERVYAGLNAASRDRTLFGREMAVRIEWRRDQTGNVRVLGAREASPAASRGIEVPENLQSEVTDLAFDPDQLQLNLFAFGAGDRDDDEQRAEGVRTRRDSTGARVSVDSRRDTAGVTINVETGPPIDPLLPGSEAHYRFRSGDTTTVRLPDGSRLRLIQLEIIPRRRDFRLLRGTLWIDEQTHGVARSVLSTARAFDLRRDAGDDIPRVVNTFGAIRAEVRYVTVEYALFQGRYWLPRLVAVDAQANLGILAGVPVRFERSYADYEVEASPTPQQAPVSVLAQRDTTAARVCEEQAKAAGETCECSNGRCQRWRVEVPADTAALLASADLPPPLAEGNARLITGEEVESLARVLTPSLGRMGDFAPELTTGFTALRYNRVEALSAGVRADVAWGPLTLGGEARLGVGDLEPSATLGITRESLGRRTRLAGYRRLSAFDPQSRALGLGASLNALVLGRDEADYLRASGAELTSEPVRAGRWSYAWRLFGEHQHPVSRTTQVSLARAWDEEPFRGVRPADRADQGGASLALSRAFGSDRSAARLNVGTWVEGQAGTFEYGRGQATARLTVPSLGRFALALETAAGTTTGDVPLQGMWYLGGASTVRGYEGALLGGESFWRARGEVATPLPAARLVLFSDAGWAGARDAWDFDPPLLSAGVGASFLDGLIRVDLARALRSPTGWRVDLYLDGSL